MIGRLQRRWRGLISEFGHAGLAVAYLLHRVLHRWSGGRFAIVPYLLVAQPVGNPHLSTLLPGGGIVVRRIGPDDPVIVNFPRIRAVNEQRFAAGAECYVAWVKDRFAGHIWVARGSYREDEVRCDFEIAESAAGVWDYDVYVEPEFRLGRTLARLWKAVDDSLAAQGMQWTFSRINRFNAGSLRSHQRLGAREVGRISFVALGPVQVRLGGGVRMAIGWSAGRRPACRLAPPVQRRAEELDGA
jgi:hypothetical protein